MQVPFLHVWAELNKQKYILTMNGQFIRFETNRIMSYFQVAKSQKAKRRNYICPYLIAFILLIIFGTQNK